MHIWIDITLRTNAFPDIKRSCAASRTSRPFCGTRKIHRDLMIFVNHLFHYRCQLQSHVDMTPRSSTRMQIHLRSRRHQLRKSRLRVIRTHTLRFPQPCTTIVLPQRWSHEGIHRLCRDTERHITRLPMSHRIAGTGTFPNLNQEEMKFPSTARFHSGFHTRRL